MRDAPGLLEHLCKYPEVPIARLFRRLTAVGLSVKNPLEALTEHDLIIRQKHTQIVHCTSSFMGSSRCAVTPPVGFSV